MYSVLLLDCMVCCVLLLFDDGPVDDDPRSGYAREWATPLISAPCQEPVWFCAGLVLPSCSAYLLRKEALGGNMSNYSCCQGYFDCAPCFQAGKFGEADNPELCLLIEACFCTHFAVQATRFHMMDTRNIRPDPTDNRVIRLHNCLQCLSFIADMAACISKDAEMIDAAQAIRIVADCVYITLLSCFAAQTKAELKAEQKGGTTNVAAAPIPIQMARGGPAQPVQAIPVAHPVTMNRM